jgi:molecular chaperone DnaK
MDEILLGIDFGTTNTVISYFNNNKSNIMSDGVYKMIPSKIGYIEDRVYCGNYIPLNCDNIVHSFKLLDDNSEYLIIFFKHIYDLIIKNLKCDVIKAVINNNIKAVINNNIKAVITVPSNFNDTQRENIRRCFNLVNIKVIRIINEPSSAALAYGMNSSSNTFEKILVIDTGGGTMDFTILEKSEMFFEVIDSRGLNNLGGNNFTDIIFNYFKDLSWNNCQKMKEKLSYLDSFEIKDNNKNYFMTRNTFNNLTQELIKQMEEILTEMCINIDINHIILVGGTSRIPILQESIKKIMNKNIWIHPNLETVVAEGAGLYCGIIENKYKSIDDIILLDVVPLSLGIELADGTYSIIIPKNTPLPVKRTNKYTTESSSESSVKIKIYQGERTIASKNFLIGEYIFDKISTIAVPIIEITFKIDLNSIINVIITDKKSGIDKNIIIKDIVKYSEEEVDDIIKKSSKLNTLDENELTINQNIYLIKSFIEKILINLSVNELIDKIKKEEILMNIQEIENKLETYTYLQLIETLKNLETNYSLLGTIYEDNEINNNNNNNNNNNMLLLDKKLELEDKVKSLLEIHPEWEEYLTPVLENLSYTNVSIEYINEKLNDIKELE